MGMSNRIGVIYSIFGEQNEDKFQKIFLESLDFRDEHKDKLLVYLTTVVHASYSNRLGEPRQVWFLDGDEVTEKDTAPYTEAAALSEKMDCNFDLDQLKMSLIDDIEKRVRTRTRCGNARHWPIPPDRLGP
jgi:hypothetical protein